jgi:hypothetical protein
MTVQRLINLAFFELGEVQSAEAPNSDESTDALDTLNHIISLWSIEGVTCYNRRHYSVAAGQGSESFTIGPTGSWATTARPVKLEGATSYYLTFRQGMEIVSMAEFALRSTAPKGHTQPLPELLGVDNQYPTLNAKVFPVSSLGCTVELHTLEPLTAFEALTDVIDLPPGYEANLKYALAGALYPQYAREGGMDPALAANIQNAKSAIVQINEGMMLPQPQQQQQQQ